ncbi:hypothetical protein OCU04_006647 [Sclerotinia nivalis]|uniref:Transcription factor CBF/NF-Y/archaeal histone domain-containing protein n=1 Tax=Sclerotinia nivalis TaxID=352851 RepID=A0A9X0AK64_9HELO|nr:hypothetical protein OCU04_006647 [Sclerotinia nivalis]
MDSTYTPQSPDLSGFLAPDTNRNQQTSYAPRSPVIPDFSTTTSTTSPTSPTSPTPNTGTSAFTSSRAAQSLQPQNQYLNYRRNQQIFAAGGNSTTEFNQYDPYQYMLPIPALPSTLSFGIQGTNASITAPQFYYPSHSQAIKSESDYNNNSSPAIANSQFQSQYQNTSPTISSEIPYNHRIPSPFNLTSYDPISVYQYNNNNISSLFHENHNPNPVDMSTRQPRQPRGKSQPNIPNTFDPSPQYNTNMSTYALAPQPPLASAPPTMTTKNPNPDNIEIRTKFPVARIKRIMQADEEVGKVAQVTPVAVSKALELFMISLVQGAARVAREKGGKRVTAGCLKRVVEGDEQFDFLSEIVGRVQEIVPVAKEEKEGGEGSGKKRKASAAAKKEEGSESEVEVDENMGVEPKKKGRGKGKGGREKKIEVES